MRSSGTSARWRLRLMPLPIDLVNEHRLYLALLSLLVPACAWPVLKGKSLKLVLALGHGGCALFRVLHFQPQPVWASEVSFVGRRRAKIPEYCRTLQ